MSPQLSARCLLAVLAAMLLASTVGLLAMGPVALAMPSMERGLGLYTFVPLFGLVASAAGWRWATGLPGRDARRAWRAFFGAAVLAASLCLIESLVASVPAWWLGRMAIGSAGAVAGLIFLAERLGARWIAPRAVALGLLAGPIAAAVGLAAQAVHGQADERLLIWLECAPLLLLPLGVWGLPTRGLRDADWLVALGFFAAAKAFEVLDKRFDVGVALDGQVVAQLGLAVSVGFLACAVRRQSLASTPDAADASRRAASSARARDTSAKTAA